MENFINSFPNHQPFNTLFSQDTVSSPCLRANSSWSVSSHVCLPAKQPVATLLSIDLTNHPKTRKNKLPETMVHDVFWVSPYLWKWRRDVSKTIVFLYNRAIFRWPMIMGGRVGLIAGTFPRLQDRNLSSTQLSACASDAAEKVCAWDTVRTMLKSSLNRETPVWCRDRYIPPQKTHGISWLKKLKKTCKMWSAMWLETRNDTFFLELFYEVLKRLELIRLMTRISIQVWDILTSDLSQGAKEKQSMPFMLVG